MPFGVIELWIGSDDDDDYAEIALAGSRMGIMRRGLHAPQALQQPNRQWTRATDGDKIKDGSGSGSIKPKLTEQEELEQMDPAARAARLAFEKQRREQEAILEARREENESNVLRSPALFSKRTAFDIRFDQIEEKPWERNLAPGERATTEQLTEVCLFYFYWRCVNTICSFCVVLWCEAYYSGIKVFEL